MHCTINLFTKKTETMKNALKWVSGILILLCIIPAFTVSQSYISAICFFVSGIVCIPATLKDLENRIGAQILTPYKYAMVIGFWLLGTVVFKAPEQNTPDKIMAKLSQMSIGSFGDWKKDATGFHASTSYYSFGVPIAEYELQSNISMYLESEKESKVQIVKIIVNQNNPKDYEKAIEFFTEKSKLLYKILGVEMPKEFESDLRLKEEFDKEFILKNKSRLQKGKMVQEGRYWYKLTIYL